MLKLSKPWDSQPQEAVRLRDDLGLIPIGGILPSGYGFGDTSGAPLTVGTGFSRTVTKDGIALDSTAANTGLTRTESVTDHGGGLSFVFVGEVDGAGFQCLGSIASSGDKTVRVFGLDGTVRAQHIGATTAASADAAGVWQYGKPQVAIAVFDSPTSVRVYGRGTAGTASGSSTTNVGALGAMTKLAFGVYDGSSKLYNLDGRTNFAQWFRGSISDSFARDLLGNPWQLFAPRSIWVPVSTAGGSVTGTSATTNANDTSAASGTTTIVGTSATTNAADTATASGSVGGAVTGTSATTNANDTSSASGTTTVTGTVAYSNANDSAAASGWAGSVSGTAAVTNANDTAQASGTVEGGATDTHDGFWSREWAKLKKREEKKPTIAEVVEIVKESPQVMEVVREEVERKYPQVDYAAVRENVQLQRFIAKQLIEAAEEEDDIETLLLMA